MNFQIVLLVTALTLCRADEEEFIDPEAGPPQPYKFGYDVSNKDGDQWRTEVSDGFGHVRGSYGFVDNDGIHREVEYVADDGGFRVKIKTNEPGMDVPNPASVQLMASPPSDYEAHVYGVEHLHPDGRSNVLLSPGEHKKHQPFDIPKVEQVKDFGAFSQPKEYFLVAQPGSGQPNSNQVFNQPKQYHGLEAHITPPVYVVDGHLQSPWFPMDTVARV